MTDETSRSVPGLLRSGPVLAAVFAGLGLLAAVGVVFLLGGGTDHLLWALVAGIVGAGSVVGSYVLGRRYGQPHSHAFGQAVFVFGVLLLAAVVAELLRSAGQISNVLIVQGLGGAVLGAALVIGIVVVLERATAT